MRMRRENQSSVSPPREASGGGRWQDTRPSGFHLELLLYALFFLSIAILAVCHWWNRLQDGEPAGSQFITSTILTFLILAASLRMFWFWHRSRQIPGPYPKKVRRSPG